MIKVDAGTWEAVIDHQVVGFHYYSHLIDWVSVAEPASECFFDSGKMSVGIEIPEAGFGFYFVNNVTDGEI